MFRRLNNISNNYYCVYFLISKSQTSQLFLRDWINFLCQILENCSRCVLNNTSNANKLYPLMEDVYLIQNIFEFGAQNNR